MGKRAVFSILTHALKLVSVDGVALAEGSLKIHGAKFGFVFIWVVEFFNSVMRFGTSVTIRTVLTFLYSVTLFRLISTKFPSAILISIMPKHAFLLAVVRISIRTLLCLKSVEIKKL